MWMDTQGKMEKSGGSDGLVRENNRLGLYPEDHGMLLINLT